MNKNLTAIDLANYIIWYVNKNTENQLTQLKLQKILYYVYVTCLVKHDLKLFKDPIEKWKFGPVVSSVYHKYKSMGSTHIEKPEDSYIFNDEDEDDFSFEVIPFNEKDIISALDSDVISDINSEIEELSSLSPFALVEKTHREEAWKKFEKHIANGAQGLKYSDKEIKECFNS